MTIADAATAIEAKRLSPVELVQACLRQVDITDSQVRAFVTRVDDRAVAAAKQAEGEILGGSYRGPLHGIPYVLKDLIATEGIRTSAGSRVLADWIPSEDAAVAARLAAAGAILLGKVTTHEFAFDVHTPPTSNPWDPSRIPGGSSGGSGAALAARQTPAALGTDTGGSVRIPAALCGVVGLKPTHGIVSRRGVIAASWSLDSVGPMARTAHDVAILLDAIVGYDAGDPGSVAFSPNAAEGIRAGVDGLRVGVPSNFFFDGATPSVRAAVADAIDVLRWLGCVVAPVSVPDTHLVLSPGDAITFPEASLYHRRWLRERPGDYGPAVRRRLELGELQLATDYLQAQRVRTVVIAEMTELMRRIDVLISPTTPITAPAKGQDTVEIEGDQISTLAALCRVTSVANFTGFPGVTAPCGFDADGLPIGLHLLGRPFEDTVLLRTVTAFQRETQWHERRPPLAVAQSAG